MFLVDVNLGTPNLILKRGNIARGCTFREASCEAGQTGNMSFYERLDEESLAPG